MTTWLPIDSAPEGETILVWDDGCGIADKTGDGSFYIWNDPEPHKCYPTHWMPLPKAPNS